MSAVSVASALPPALSSWRSLALRPAHFYFFFYFLFPASFSYLFTPPSLMIGCCVRCGFSSLRAVSRIYHSSVSGLCVVSANLHLLEPARTQRQIGQYFCRRGNRAEVVRAAVRCPVRARVELLNAVFFPKPTFASRMKAICACQREESAGGGVSFAAPYRKATPLAVHYAAHKSSWLRPIR